MLSATGEIVNLHILAANNITSLFDTIMFSEGCPTTCVDTSTASSPVEMKQLGRCCVSAMQCVFMLWCAMFLSIVCSARVFSRVVFDGWNSYRSIRMLDDETISAAF